MINLRKNLCHHLQELVERRKIKEYKQLIDFQEVILLPNISNTNNKMPFASTEAIAHKRLFINVRVNNLIPSKERRRAKELRRQ
jgi:hypothetical protein